MGTKDIGSAFTNNVASNREDKFIFGTTCLVPAVAVNAFGVFFIQRLNASRSEDESGVNETVEHLASGFKHLLIGVRHIVLVVLVKENRKSGLVVRNKLGQTDEIEVVLDVILIDLHEELVSFQAAEPLNPSGFVVPLRHGSVLRR
jgi:hypothetical protein